MYAGRNTRALTVARVATRDCEGISATIGAAPWVIMKSAATKSMHHGFRIVYHFRKPLGNPVPQWHKSTFRVTR